MPVNASYLLGALRDYVLTRETKIVDSMVLHADSNQLDPMHMFMMIARISELRSFVRDLEREARQEVERMGRGEHGA